MALAEQEKAAIQAQLAQAQERIAQEKLAAERARKAAEARPKPMVEARTTQTAEAQPASQPAAVNTNVSSGRELYVTATAYTAN